MLIRATQVVDAVQRKPEEYKSQSFFGKYDIWRYEGIADERLCEECLRHVLQFYYLGNELRAEFPYLEIENENLIKPHVHPNCRCLLHRVTESHEYLEVLAHYS